VPEGDTVWLAARHLHAALAGRTLTGSDFRVPHLATVDLSGSVVAEVVPRGKHLLFRLTGGPGEGTTLHTHFRMDGSWHLYPDGQRWRGGAEHQIRVVLRADGIAAVGYRLPVVALIRTAEEDAAVGHLGPDLLDPEVDLGDAVRRLSRDPGRPVGEAILDQRNVAGIGNLYRTESLFLAGVTPFTPIGRLAEYGSSAPAILGIARRLLTVNAARAIQSTTGMTRRDAWHWVFERRTCLRCGARVATALSGDATRERIAYWCPADQAGPAPESVPPSRLLPRTVGRTRYRP
jgi:endonuclease-8